MTTIRETRELTIRERVITLDNIRALSKILFDEFNSLNSEKSLTELSFSAKCIDESSFQSEDIEMFNKDSVLAKKRVERISMELRHYDSRSFIEIKLAHGNDEWRNGITIRGTDSKWVNGTLKSIEETIESFKPQNVLLYRKEHFIKSVFALGLGSLYIWVVTLIPYEPYSDTPAWANKLHSILSSIPLGNYLFKYLIAFGVGYIPADYLYKKLKGLWPSVELQIGPEHTYIERRRRVWIAYALILGVLPLLSSMAYDLIKNLVVDSG